MVDRRQDAREPGPGVIQMPVLHRDQVADHHDQDSQQKKRELHPFGERVFSEFTPVDERSGVVLDRQCTGRSQPRI
jgi:hypothetical protein